MNESEQFIKFSCLCDGERERVREREKDITTEVSVEEGSKAVQ